jgi:hypothetical protein
MTDFTDHAPSGTDVVVTHETAIVRYDQARRWLQTLAEDHNIDGVKTARDKYEALAAYARQAKDTDMIKWVTEIKVRAERVCGELLRESAERGERARVGGDRDSIVERYDYRNKSFADIQESNDYQKFLPRDDPPRRTPKRFFSMMKDGWLAEHPMCVEERDGVYIVMDGWSRFVAARQLGIPVRYIVGAPRSNPPPTLAQIGITRDESSRYQRLASIPAEKFEATISLAKEKPGGVTTAFMLKQVAVMKPTKPPEVEQRAERLTPDKRAEQIRGLVEAGNNLSQIAKTLHICDEYVAKILRTYPDIPRPAGFGIRHRTIRVDVVVGETVSSLTGLAQGIDLIRDESFESISAEQAHQMAAEVTMALSSIRWLATKLKGVSA